MKGSAAARRYARALFGLARETDAVASVRGQLDQLQALLEESPDLRRSLFEPLHPAAQRRALLDSLCQRLGTSPLLRNFYAFLIDQRRLVDFPAIHEEYARLADEAAGRTRAEVVSANPLSEAQRQRLREALSRRTGREVELSIRVDPALLGGAVASVGGLVFDGTLRTQLGQLRDTLTRGQ